MILVPIASVPNQTFTITLDSNQYDLSLYVINDVTAMDIIRNTVTIVLGIRVVAFKLIIPYRYLEDGNFFFTSDNGDYPYYQNFNVNQQLIYISQTEIDSNKL